MDLENRHGQTEPSILESGEKIGLMVKEGSFMLMVAVMKEIGKMIKLMGMERMYILMVVYMKDI